MSSVVNLYEALTTATDERARARVIAEAFERLEDRYPHLPDLATQGHVRESELRLQKEIEQVRGDIARIKTDLLKWLVPLMLAQVAAIAALVKLH
ncbi:DUF1640 domain-containing protein [Thiohalocapsa marina]|uniref:DUF1640 domain-containing protein n=1 Tax=Thiohalocapsa marina TaxID=424902 RepID=A0A5M8FIF5_9GAMM|nr:DUF1640 domain-containing protein [Thiohalocapsa marina]KAA6184713.1 DUF1640 domain-containing protein [Thiohalocapsa marina]